MLCWKRVIWSTVWWTTIMLSDQCLGGEMRPFAEKFEEQCKISGVLGIEQPRSTIFLLHTSLVARIFSWQVATAKWMQEFGAFSTLSSVSPLLTSLMLLLFLGCLSLLWQPEIIAQHRLLWYLTESFPSRHTRKKHRFVLLPGQESCLTPGWGLLLTFH